MLTNQIKNRTIKDIFEELLGEEKANIVLTRIQEEYDKGVRGEALKDFAEIVIKENIDLKPDSLRFVMAAIAIIVV